MQKLALFGLFFCVQSAFASITTYSDRATFDAAVGPTTVETFTDSYHFPIPNGVLNSTTAFSANGTPLNAGDIKAGVTYSTPVVIGSIIYFNIDTGGGFSGGFLDGFNTGNPLTITFDTPKSAFGFDANNFMSNFDVVINLGSTPLYTMRFIYSGSSFFGFQSSQSDISSLTIHARNSNVDFGIDNFSFGGSASAASTNVPEPGPYALLIAGLAGIGLMRRYTKKTG